MIKKALIVSIVILCTGCSSQPKPMTVPTQDHKVSSGESAHTSDHENLQQLHAEVKANPNNPEVLYRLAIAYWDDAEKNSSQSSRDKALVYFKQVLSLAPDNQVTLQAIYNIHYKNTLHQGQRAIAQAKSSYQALLPEMRQQLNPPSLALFIHDYLKQSEAKEKDYPALQKLLLDAIAEQPGNDNAYIHLASIYRNQGYYPMALASLKLASEQIPDSAELFAAIAKTYEARAESTGCNYEDIAPLNLAIDYYKRAIPLDASNPTLHFHLAQLYTDKNQYQLALNESQIMLDLDPTPENLAFLAQQYSMHNNPAKAKFWLSKAQQQGLNADDASIHEIYMNAGDWSSAARAFKNYAKPRKYLNVYDAIKADIISQESNQDLLALVREKEIHFGTDWEAAVFAFWTNKITQQQLADQAKNRCERTEMYFYSGYRDLASGNNYKATQELAAALQENTYRFIERPLARYFLENIH